MGKRPKKIKGFKKDGSFNDILKRPRVDKTLIDRSLGRPVWLAGAIDLDGPWGWKDVDYDLFFSGILPKIQNFEKMQWDEILNRNNHEVSVELISKDAQKRLMALKLDDFEKLVSLRFTGKQRLWGIKIEDAFKILWWDPDHTVYPSKLKHT